MGQRLIELAQEWRRFGYRRLHVLIRREGVVVNHKRVSRLCQQGSTQTTYTFSYSDTTTRNSRLTSIARLDASAQVSQAVATLEYSPRIDEKRVWWPEGVQDHVNLDDRMGNVWLPPRCIVGDFNGDGRADVACFMIHGTDWQVATSTNNGWAFEPRQGPLMAGESIGNNIHPWYLWGVGMQCLAGGGGQPTADCDLLRGDKPNPASGRLAAKKAYRVDRRVLCASDDRQGENTTNNAADERPPIDR